MATASSSFTTPSLTSISSAAAGLVTIGTAHGWEVGDVVGFQGLTEMTELNGTTATIITVPASTTFTIGDTSDNTAEATGGVDTIFLVVDSGGYLRTGAKGEDVTIDTITFNGVATGGKIYDHIELIDIATDKWLVSGQISQSGGSEVTPFSSAA
ncbi:hypothetical protein LCGC14_2554010 [marine sediment metagenome]|uniref:Ubiquitin-activating enzyme E1 FCCH domain-containing protein n=1 Tax=marine sediment metagenome TaxID=412755 RepID=A0A0F9DF63_9ZZZZ